MHIETDETRKIEQSGAGRGDVWEWVKGLVRLGWVGLGWVGLGYGYRSRVKSRLAGSDQHGSGRVGSGI